MKIYTKTGDKGDTGLFHGPRVAKDDLRVEAYGTVDELNAALGLVRAEELPASLDELLEEIQHNLFALGAELATPDPAEAATDLIHDGHVQRLEQAIDLHDAQLEPLMEFILPAGSRPAALLHVARGVCRYAERRLVTLQRAVEGPFRDETLRYLNRLSDLLFVLARWVNHQAGRKDTPWKKP